MNRTWIKYDVISGKRGSKFHVRRNYKNGKPYIVVHAPQYCGF